MPRISIRQHTGTTRAEWIRQLQRRAELIAARARAERARSRGITGKTDQILANSDGLIAHIYFREYTTKPMDKLCPFARNESHYGV
jgi:hypothetical protein